MSPDRTTELKCIIEQTSMSKKLQYVCTHVYVFMDVNDMLYERKCVQVHDFELLTRHGIFG